MSRALAAAVLLTVASVSPAAAHEGGSNGYATITVEGGRVRYQLTLWPASLPAPVGEQIRRAREGDAASRDRLLGMVRDKVTLSARGGCCEAGAGSVAAASPPAESLILTVEYACAGDGRDLLLRDDLFDVLGPDYHTLARVETAHRAAHLAFTLEMRESRLTPAAGGIVSFVRLGVEHILTGWDHLLFLLALLLRSGGWLALLKVITAFTAAHSVTLALAALDVVTPPERLVEAGIALSIAIVAADNLVARPVVARRWLVSGAFGLIHGFGFSSVLRELGLPAQGLVLSLLGFNLGVELGQALVVAAALPALWLLRGSRWESRLSRGASAAVLLVGAVLFVDRALF